MDESETFRISMETAEQIADLVRDELRENQLKYIDDDVSILVKTIDAPNEVDVITRE